MKIWLNFEASSINQILPKSSPGGSEMARLLRVLTAISEDLGLSLSVYPVANNHLCF